MFFKRQTSCRNSIASLLISGLLYFAGAAPTFAESQPSDPPPPPPLSIFGSEGTVEPFYLSLGTPANWGYLIPDNKIFDAGAIKTEPAKVGKSNGIKVTWTGGMAQIYSQSANTMNLIGYPISKGALVFDAIVHKVPAGQVTMRVDCVYPCRGTVDMTKMYQDMPLETKRTIKIALSCFSMTGTKFTIVNTPMLIFTDKPFVLSLANIRWLPGAGLDADAAKCGN
jgi:hypothetical protein